MSTITAVLDPHADGTLHLPIPDELRGKKVRVVATLEPENDASNAGTIRTGTVLEALEALRKRGGLRHVIPDPVAWQRQQREDRTFPERPE